MKCHSLTTAEVEGTARPMNGPAKQHAGLELENLFGN